MNAEIVAWLQTSQASALAALVDPSQHLASMSRLRTHTTPERAAALFEVWAVRAKAQSKFHDGDELWFTQTAFEQASHERVSQHRAQCLAGAQHILDVCCGCGGDLMALATQAPTIGIDIDAGRVALANANIRQRQLQTRAQALVADVVDYVVPDSIDAVFFDPGRRHQQRRIMHHDAYQPPLLTAERWLTPHRTVAIKCAPGIDYEHLPFSQPYSIECVSYAGDMRETVVWFNQAHTWRRRATLLTDTDTYTLTDLAPSTPVDIRPPATYFYEPDSAVIRAGLVRHLAYDLGAAMLDPQIAYLTHTQYIDTPFARCWRILESMPFAERAIRERLHALGSGAVTVKKRGSPVDSDQLARRLSRPQGRPLVVVLTRVSDVHTALICEGPYQPKEACDDSSS